VDRIFHLQQLIALALEHARDRDICPCADDLGDVFGRHFFAQHPRFPVANFGRPLFKLDELRFSGHGDPLAALVLCGAHRADRVMVGGNWVVTGGAIPGLDVSDLIRRHSAAARAMHGG
jgi:hypothetical protein